MATAVNNSITALENNSLVMLCDDNGDAPVFYLLCAAESVTPEDVSFLVNNARGVICAALNEERAKRLHLPMMTVTQNDDSPHFTVSVEARHGVTTGISAADRATTLQVLATTEDADRDLIMPGHIFPVRAKDGGVLVRQGVTESVTDLLSLAKLPTVGAFCHCLNQQGDFINSEQAKELCNTHSIPLVCISDIIRHRMASESLVEKIAEAELPTRRAGTFRAFAFRSLIDDAEHIALVRGDVALKDAAGNHIPVLVRVQSEHLVGDLLGTESFRSRRNIIGALKSIDEADRGIFVYVRHPRKGVLGKQVAAMDSQESSDNKASQVRELGTGAQILSALGVEKIRLLTNSKRPISGIDAFHLTIVERVPFEPASRSQTKDLVPSM